MKNEQSLMGGNTHAWVQAYIPGPGWVDFDPSAGVVGNHNLIRVGMQVAVRVKAVRQ
jgi:transglutaminase-like putative cysteine protease